MSRQKRRHLEWPQTWRPLNVPEAKAENDEVGQEKQIVMKDGILREGFGDVAF